MKKLLLAVSLIVLGVSIGEARMVSTRYQCVTACGQATNATCGWITKPGKYNACRNRLLRQCRKWGVDTMCPATTTVAHPTPTTTTTTTVPYVPPTTTTIPAPVDPLSQFKGTTWDFVYTLVSTWDDTYSLGFTIGYTSNGTPVLDGTNEYGDNVGIGPVTDPSIPYHFLLLDPESSICEAFFFNITGPRSVSGEVFFFYTDCQTPVGSGTPHPFYGTMR